MKTWQILVIGIIFSIIIVVIQISLNSKHYIVQPIINKPEVLKSSADQTIFMQNQMLLCQQRVASLEQRLIIIQTKLDVVENITYSNSSAIKALIEAMNALNQQMDQLREKFINQSY